MPVRWLMAVVALAVVACGTGSAEAPPATPPSWVAGGPPAHSDIVATDNTVVHAIAEGRRLHYVGRSVVDGQERWRSEGHVGLRPPGRRMRPAVRDGVLFHLALDRERHQSVVVAIEVDTGAVRWRTTVAGVADDGIGCEPGSVEVIYDALGRREFRRARLDVATGVIRSDESMPDRWAGGSSLGNARTREHASPESQPDLDLAWDPERVVLAAIDGRPGWELTVEDAFAGLPVSFGRGYLAVPRDGVWFVWAGPADPLPARGVPVGAVIAVDASGTVLWRRADRRPCALADDPVGPLFCDGEYHKGPGGWELRPAILERLDPRTGSPRWQARVEGAWNVAAADEPLVRLSDHEIVVRGPAGGMLVDVERGPVAHPPPAGSTGWCRSSGGGDDLENAYGNPTDFGRAEVHYPCRSNGEALDAPEGSYVPAGATIDVSGVTIWIGPDGRVRGQARV